MSRHQWGEEVGRGHELASTQWARRLHAKTSSDVEGPGASTFSLGNLGHTLSCKM